MNSIEFLDDELPTDLTTDELPIDLTTDELPIDLTTDELRPRLVYTISDLHVEHYNTLNDFMVVLDKVNLPNADFLVLAGDICDPVNRIDDYINLLLFFKKKYKNVILIAGNHEYYSCKYNRNLVVNNMRVISNKTGVIFLNRDNVVVDGVRFIGATLWTAIEKSAADQMTDFRQVFESRVDYILAFTEDFKFIKESLLHSLDYDEPVIVVTHHLPNIRLIHPRFKGLSINTGFYTHITDLVNLKGVKYWFCGHTHEQMTISISDVVFAVNPMGYPKESRMTKTLNIAYVI